MSDRLSVDHGHDGHVSVSAWLYGELAPGPASEAFELSWPLDGDALEDVRWYDPKSFRDDPVFAYAFEAQARHWWEAGGPDLAVATLAARTSHAPAPGEG